MNSTTHGQKVRINHQKGKKKKRKKTVENLSSMTIKGDLQETEFDTHTQKNKK
jgi:hypothetical protein